MHFLGKFFKWMEIPHFQKPGSLGEVLVSGFFKYMILSHDFYKALQSIELLLSYGACVSQQRLKAQPRRYITIVAVLLGPWSTFSTPFESLFWFPYLKENNRCISGHTYCTHRLCVADHAVSYLYPIGIYIVHSYRWMNYCVAFKNLYFFAICFIFDISVRLISWLIG